MDNIINTFYRGNINKFGFGGWNTTKNNIKEIIADYPYPSNWNRQIDRYFQKSNIKDQINSRNERHNYVPNEVTKSIPISQRVDFSKSNAVELKPITIDQYKNFDNHGFMNTQLKTLPLKQDNFSPALIRMEYLENKVREIEEKNRAEMIKSLSEVNNKFIDPRFKKFLDNNQIGKYDIFGNEIDPLMERRKHVQNSLDSMRNHLDVEERRERKIRRKFEKKMKLKRKKKKKNIFEDSEESKEESQNEEIDELLTKDNNNQENMNTLPQKTGTPIVSPYDTRGSIARPSITSATNRRATGVRKSLVNTLIRNQTEANTQNITQSGRRSSIKMKATQKSVKNSDKSTKEGKESKDGKLKPVKVCGDIGYSFSAKNLREKELQFQTNRLGKDFDKLLNEIRNFKAVLKDKIDLNNNDEMNKLNIYKDIFLLDNKAKMKHAVDKIINNTTESFDSEQYQKKVDNEKQNEINNIINKKIDDYNNYMDRVIYARKINNEKMQMDNSHLVNKYEYQKYRHRLNNQIISLPNIFIKPTYNMTDKRQKTIEPKEIKSIKDNEESKKKTPIVIDIVGSEETIKDFGTSIDGDNQFRTKEIRSYNEKSETIRRFVEEKSSNINSRNRHHKNMNNKDKNKNANINGGIKKDIKNEVIKEKEKKRKRKRAKK